MHTTPGALLVLCPVLCLAAGCGRSPHLLGLAAGADGPVDPLVALQAETGHPWTVRWHEETHTPALLQGRTAPLAATPGDAARAGRDFLLAHAALFALGAHDDLRGHAGTTDELGMTHVHFTHEVAGHPVWGSELLAHFASDGALVTVNGRLAPVALPSPTPLRTGDEARVLAVAALKAELGSALDCTTHTPKLYVYPLGPDEATLAWRIEVQAKGEELFAYRELFIDAADGHLIAVHDLVRHLDGHGVGSRGEARPLSVAADGKSYILEDQTRGKPPLRTYTAQGKVRLPGIAVRSKDVGAWDTAGPAAGAAVDAHALVARSWDYFAKVHGHPGFDGSGKGPEVTVHFGVGLADAFFDGSRLVFGDGDGQTFAPLAGALDLVAHEFTHGVVAETGLFTSGPGAAVDEGLADLFACFIEGDWQVGEAVYHPDGTSRPLRDVADPHATGQPATMSERNADAAADDPHRDGSIVAHAGYLMAMALPRATVEKIWFRALHRYLFAAADFADLADATRAAAGDLDPGALAAVGAAWQAVGVRE